MPECGSYAVQLREEGIQKLDAFLTAAFKGTRLSSAELSAYAGRSLIAGWQVYVRTDQEIRRLRIVLDQRFPISLPHFFLVDRPEFLIWPHVERDGLLCLQAGNRIGKPDYPVEVVEVLLGQALELIQACENGSNENDFRSEFYSYWNRSVDDAADSVYSLLKAEGPSRLIKVWRGDTCSVVGESEGDILSWQRNRHGSLPQFDSTDCACLLWLPSALLPREYPRTARDLYRLSETVPGGRNLLEQFSKMGKSPYYFILGADSGNGPCLAAVKTWRPVSVDIRGRTRNRLLKGFRPNKVPRSVEAFRLFSDGGVSSRLKATRVDPAWIHGRGHDRHQQTLAGKKVVILGCGSLGAPIAQQLVMSGVGHVSVVDPENLEWANIGRHPLGAEYVGQNKAEAVAEKLRRSYPHSTIEGFGVSFEEFALLQPNLLSEAHLVLGATAEWESEGLLDIQRIRAEITGNTLYAWTEPHACAGHAVLLAAEGPCLQCGMTALGEARMTITEWPASVSQELTEPACGAVFQPYGPVELLGTIAVVCSLSLDSLLQKRSGPVHRVWAVPQAMLIDAGGKWSESWLVGHPERAIGGIQEELEWKRDDACPICGRNDTGEASVTQSATPANDSFSIPQSSTI